MGHCTQLRRECVEPWTVDDSIYFSMETNIAPTLIIQKLITPKQMLPHISTVNLSNEFLKPLLSGNVIFATFSQLGNIENLNSGKMDRLKSKVFVCIKSIPLMFLSDIEFIQESHIFKIMPKKKII